MTLKGEAAKDFVDRERARVEQLKDEMLADAIAEAAAARSPSISTSLSSYVTPAIKGECSLAMSTSTSMALKVCQKVEELNRW